MSEETNEFDLPKLSDALQAAYTHRPAIPASVDQAILTAARARFDQRRRLRLLARWGTGLAAAVAASVVIIISLHRPAPVKHLAQADHHLTKIDALTLANHLARHESPDPSWDLNHDNVIDQQDVQAIANAAVSLKPTLSRKSLPTLQDLGISHPVGLASASVIPSRLVGSASADATTPFKTLAQTNQPLSDEAPQ
jgi:hypothetical protein